MNRTTIPQSRENGSMTKAERADLCRYIRRSEKLSKTAAKQRAAELKVDVEQKLCKIWSPDDDVMMEALHREASGHVAAAQAKLKDRCDELGIPKSFAPGISISWYYRGETAMSERRTELRKLAYARIDAMEKTACTRIETESFELEGTILAGGLESSAAKEFLASMPSAEELMPELPADEIKLLSPTP